MTIKAADNEYVHAVPVYANRPLIYHFCHEKGKSTVIWDSKFSHGIRREILLRSPVVFRNRLENSLLLRVTLQSDNIVELGPVAEDGVLYLPLPLCNEVAFFNVRLSETNSGWSPNFTLEEFSTRAAKQPLSFMTPEETQISYATVYHESDQSGLAIIFSFNIFLSNALPCVMRYRCICDGALVLEGILLPGRSKKISHDASRSDHKTYLQISVGALDWSHPLFVYTDKFGCFQLKNSVSVCISDDASQKETKLSLNYFAKTEAFVTVVHIYRCFSKFNTNLVFTYHGIIHIFKVNTCQSTGRGSSCLIRSNHSTER